MKRMQSQKLKDDRGSLPFALLTAALVLVISVAIGGAVAWQATSVYNEQNTQDAKWAATNSINFALERVSLINPIVNQNFTGIPVTNNPTLAPPDLEWRNTPQDGVQLRWWVEKPNALDATNIIIHGEGRAGKTKPAVETITVSLTYDYQKNSWIPISVGSVRAPSE